VCRSCLPRTDDPDRRNGRGNGPDVILEDDFTVVLAADGGRENQRYGGPMRWPRTVPARVRAFDPARLDALTAGLLVLATLIELPFEDLAAVCESNDETSLLMRLKQSIAEDG
jgi:hypothetical protein